jgi:hypothetical protein
MSAKKKMERNIKRTNEANIAKSWYSNLGDESVWFQCAVLYF